MNITIILFRDNVTKSNSEWWVLNLTGNRIYNQGSQALELVVFNDKVSPRVWASWLAMGKETCNDQ